MMDVEQRAEKLDAARALAALLEEVSAVTDYRTLRDSLPRRMARLLRCRCVLLYQRADETLQFAAGSFDDKPGWSSALLTVAHINPIALDSETLEANAWRSRGAVAAPPDSAQPLAVAVPLLYRQRAIGVLVALRGATGAEMQPPALEVGGNALPMSWSEGDMRVVEALAGVVAMLLENTRLLERDRERIQELSLLNSISRQLNSTLHDAERVRSIVIQRVKEITTVDLCDCVLPTAPASTTSWLPPSLRQLLLQYLFEQREANPSPLIVERAGNGTHLELLNALPAQVKTFFALPLWSGRSGGRPRNPARVSFGNVSGGYRLSYRDDARPTLIGMVVGAYQRPWKLRREELVLLQVLASQAGAVLENIALVEDVMEARNEARKLLRQVLEDQRLKELILEHMPAGLLTVNTQGYVTTWNRVASTALGYHPYEVVGQPVDKLFGSALFQSVLQSGTKRRETLEMTQRDGQEVVLDMTLLPLRDDGAELIGALATFTDVTAMYLLEEEKRRLDRLASLGEMAASVAHEVRNPLASIKTSMQMLMDDVKNRAPAGDTDALLAGEWMEDSIEVVLKEVERLDSIVRDLLLFARPRHLHFVECHLIALSERVLRLVEAQCVEAGVVVHRVYHDIPPVYVDMSQMEQVFINLLLNALQAMPEGGILTLSCQLARREDDALSETAAAPGEEQQWIEFAISDTGVGIAPEQLERIFQPFFTTKAHGIGLGLPISRRLVEDHQGQLLVESQQGYGSTFTIRLPLKTPEEQGGKRGEETLL